jgi:hypothetical protein
MYMHTCKYMYMHTYKHCLDYRSTLLTQFWRENRPYEKMISHKDGNDTEEHYAHRSAHTCVCMYVWQCMCMCVCMCVCVYMDIYIHRIVFSRRKTVSTPSCIHDVYIYVYVYVHIYTHTHTYIYIYIYMPTPSCIHGVYIYLGVYVHI